MIIKLEVNFFHNTGRYYGSEIIEIHIKDSALYSISGHRDYETMNKVREQLKSILEDHKHVTKDKMYAVCVSDPIGFPMMVGAKNETK